MKLPFLEDLDHDQAKRHAEALDRELDLRAPEVEAEILASTRTPEGQEFWVGLPIQTLLTPYLEIRQMLSRLDAPAGSLVLDLGAGYGRMAWVVAQCFPDLKWMGIEVVGARVREGRRFLEANGVADPQLLEGDLTAQDFILPEADAYFLYDYGSAAAIRKTLGDLREIARRQAITIIARGRRSRDLIEREEPWLATVIAPRHFKNYSIFRSG